jgi:hypothetical protein
MLVRKLLVLPVLFFGTNFFIVFIANSKPLAVSQPQQNVATPVQQPKNAAQPVPSRPQQNQSSTAIASTLTDSKTSLSPKEQSVLAKTSESPTVAEKAKPTEQRSNRNDKKPSSDEYYNIFTTFMHTKKNLSAIKKAYAIYEEGMKDVIYGDVVTDGTGSTARHYGEEGDGPVVDKMTSSAYLNSIVFLSPDNWAIWLNGQKISDENNQKNKTDEFYVESIKKDEVVLVQQISRNRWRMLNANPAQSNRYNYRSNEKTNKIELSVVLHPNQTFLASKNQVIEGKYNGAEDLAIDNIDTLNNQPDIPAIHSQPEEEIDFDELFNNL